MLNVRILFILGYIIFLPSQAEAAEKATVRIAYFNKIFGHLHRRPDVNSSTLTILDCNTPVTFTADSTQKGSARWYYIKAGVYQGYVIKSNISFSPAVCFRKKFKKFFELIKIDPGEQYYWGKIYDRYEQIRTKVP